MSNNAMIRGSVEAWESGELGLSADHVRQAPAQLADQIDEALGLKPISIRLPKGVIETFKLLAQFHGVGYQPLMRDALCRFAEAEMKQVLIATVKTQNKTPRPKSAEFEASQFADEEEAIPQARRVA